MHIRYDDEGPHRVTIVVMKLYEPANVRIVAKPKRDKLTKPAESTDSQKRIASPGKYVLSRTPQREKYTGGELPADKALVDGYLVDREEAMAEIKSLLGKRRAS
jgi:hypothetical protein